MKKIGLISDTHGLLRPEVLQALEGCDAILHGGDINTQEILDRLAQISPVYAVRGNNDKEWAEHLPQFLDFSLFGLRVFMTHKKKDLPKDLSAWDLVLYGHSHKYEEKREGSTFLINPGSCGPRRFNQEITFALLELPDEGGSFEVRRMDIAHAKRPELSLEQVRTQDVEKVMRAVKKGRSVQQIAAETGLQEALAEQICRLYLTHPGVDADGIMKKMGL